MLYNSTLWCFIVAVQSVGSFMHLLAVLSAFLLSRTKRLLGTGFQLLEAQPILSLWSTCLSRVNAGETKPLRHPSALKIGPMDHRQLSTCLFGPRFQRIEQRNGRHETTHPYQGNLMVMPAENIFSLMEMAWVDTQLPVGRRNLYILVVYTF